MPLESAPATRFVSKNNIFGEGETLPYHSSTRVFHQPGGKTHDIFSTEPLPLKTSIPIDPRRYESQVSFESAPAVFSNNKRDPNWSSLGILGFEF